MISKIKAGTAASRTLGVLLLLVGISSVSAGETGPDLAGDGVTMNTKVFNTLIDHLSRAGGGTLKVPPGRYLTGTVHLQNNVTLHLEKGAVILGSTNF